MHALDSYAGPMNNLKSNLRELKRRITVRKLVVVTLISVYLGIVRLHPLPTMHDHNIQQTCVIFGLQLLMKNSLCKLTGIS